MSYDGESLYNEWRSCPSSPLGRIRTPWSRLTDAGRRRWNALAQKLAPNEEPAQDLELTPPIKIYRGSLSGRKGPITCMGYAVEDPKTVEFKSTTVEPDLNGPKDDTYAEAEKSFKEAATVAIEALIESGLAKQFAKEFVNRFVDDAAIFLNPPPPMPPAPEDDERIYRFESPS